MTDDITPVEDPDRIKTAMGLLQKEHSHRPPRMVQFIRMEVVGTGYLVTYCMWNAFPHDKINADEIRVAFMHEDGIIWDRSTRFPDPGAST
jgi:predicted amidohydrolase